MMTRTIPSSGEALTVVGLGTWQVFDVTEERYPALKNVLNAMHRSGGRLIDSSPMYGRSEETVGRLTEGMPERDDFFYATKVWTQGAAEGRKQIADSYGLMGRKVMDLVQIHNLLDWQTHLPYLRQLKEEGRLRYIGVTHYLDESHEALEKVIQQEPIDFVQFNYSITSRHAEKGLLPLCAEKGVATLINRPLGQGHLFKTVATKTLPTWATEAGIGNWSDFFLKFILSHPAVTCVIPATGKASHASENFAAGTQPFPDKKMRERMAEFVVAM